jgi:hypothetical protein
MSDTRKELGRITAARFGFGGYQDAQFGLSLTFAGKSGWGCGFFSGTWGLSISSKDAKWTEADRDRQFAEVVRLTNKTLSEAHKTDVAALVGVPVEVTFEGMVLDSWRVLTEVLG